MTDFILHHYDISPYSEKVRLGLGLKGLEFGAEIWVMAGHGHQLALAAAA